MSTMVTEIKMAPSGSSSLSRKIGSVCGVQQWAARVSADLGTTRNAAVRRLRDTPAAAAAPPSPPRSSAAA